MAVPKKCTSISKKRIRRNIWKKKGNLVSLKAFSFHKVGFYGKFQKFFLFSKQIRKSWNNLNFMIQTFYNLDMLFWDQSIRNRST